MCRCSVEPDSHEIQPGRLITTLIVTRSWAGTEVVGQIDGSPRRSTGMIPPCGPVTLMLTTFPPPSGIEIFASAVPSVDRLALDVVNVIPRTTSTTTTTTNIPRP